MKLKGILLLAVVLGITYNLDAQRWKAKRYEVVIGMGSTNIFGDIGGGASRENLMGIKDIKLATTRPALLFNARYRISPRVATKFSFIYGYGYGNDKTGPNPWRGYKFNSQIFEPGVFFEYYILTEDNRISSSAMYYHRGMASNYTRLGLYIYSGLAGAMVFNPNYIPSSPPVNPATDQPVNLSLESFKSFSFNPVVPAGIGLKYLINPDMLLGFEFSGRYSLTDYIDGYKYNNPKANKSNDIYYFTTFSVIYRIKNDRYNVPLFMQPLLQRKVGKSKGPLNPPK